MERFVPRKKYPPPPNLQPARCCGNCKHWAWGYDGEGTCKKYPDGYGSKHWNSAVDVCDDFQQPKPK